MIKIEHQGNLRNVREHNKGKVSESKFLSFLPLPV